MNREERRMILWAEAIQKKNRALVKARRWERRAGECEEMGDEIKVRLSKASRMTKIGLRVGLGVVEAGRMVSNRVAGLGWELALDYQNRAEQLKSKSGFLVE